MEHKDYLARIEFMIELARRLHAYGATALRLEAALLSVAEQFELVCEPWCNPTGMILSFSNPEKPVTADVTRVLRMKPGDIHLERLGMVNNIAKKVANGDLDVAGGQRALKDLDHTQGRFDQVWFIVAFALASAAVAALFRTGLEGVVAALLIGAAIGVIDWLAGVVSRISATKEAIVAIFATVAATLVAVFITPIAVKSVVIASIIVLIPGLSLTAAVTELSYNHWVSGTARFSGAMTTLLKMAFGTVAATQFCRWLGWTPEHIDSVPQPFWWEWVALVIAAISFGTLFRAKLKSYPIVALSAVVGYMVTRFASPVFGDQAGVFLSGFVIGAFGNAFARYARQPGSYVRVPGIILLVPGSIGFKSLLSMFERDVTSGLDIASNLLFMLISLVAGLLFGSLLIKPKHDL